MMKIYYIFIPITTTMKWPLGKMDFTSAFLQTHNTIRDVYVDPPRECHREYSSSLPSTCVYSLVNTNAKRQEHSDSLFANLGLSKTGFIPQLFYAFKNNCLDIVVVKIVDDVLIPARSIRQVT